MRGQLLAFGSRRKEDGVRNFQFSVNILRQSVTPVLRLRTVHHRFGTQGFRNLCPLEPLRDVEGPRALPRRRLLISTR